MWILLMLAFKGKYHFIFQQKLWTETALVYLLTQRKKLNARFDHNYVNQIQPSFMSLGVVPRDVWEEDVVEFVDDIDTNVNSIT